MARAKGLLLLLAAARSMTSHAADFGAPSTASMSYFTYAAASRALSAASGATAASSTAYAAASGAPAAAYAAVSSTPTIASRLLGSPAAPVGGGGNRYTLGVGALAAFAAAAVMLTTDPVPEWDLVPEHQDAQDQGYEVEGIEDSSEMEDANLKDQIVDSILGMEKGLSRRAPSARELRRMRAKMQKNDKFWKYLEDAIKKAKIVLAAVGVAKEVYALILSTITGSILLIEKYGDPVHYFVCPYSGYAEVTGIFLFSVIPKDKTQQGESSSGGPALQVKCCSETITMSLSRCEVYGKTISSFLPKDHYHRKADYIEFIAATLHLNKLECEEHLVAAFSYFDKDGSCYITVDELQQACQEHNMPYSFLDDVIEEADQDSDGRIDCGEFVAMMTKGNMGVGRRTMRNSLNISMRDAPGAL